ncbi:TonB-dependent receptor [Pelomicrobium sp. G1]|uniref:TonB-dependent receptor n=1 Tax=unclassified Pelomicrobium TaxID=2815318 RepID=UPI003F770FFE
MSRYWYTKQIAMLVAAFSAAWHSSILAQTALGEVVVSATRSERLIDLSPKSISVIDRRQIESRPMTNLQSLLDDVPGISYSRAGGLGGQLVVRGLNSNDPRMVLFVDGDRFRGRNTLEYSLLDPNEIERIEVIRGPASALYGSDAMNGVVNVITRRAAGDPMQPFSLTPRLYALGYSSTNALGATRLELQGLGNGIDALIGANIRSAGNYNTPLGEIPNSDFTSQSLNARIGYSPSATQRFEIIGKTARVESGRAGGIGGAPGEPLLKVREDPIEERYLRLGYTQNRIATWLDGLEASLYVRNLSTIIRTESRTATNGSVSFSNQYVIGPTIYGGKLLARSAFSSNVLSYGADFYYEERPGSENDARTVNAAGVTTSITARAKRNRNATQTNVGVFAHNDWDPSPRWTASLGARYDLVRTKVEGTPAVGESAVLSNAFAQNRSVQDSAVTGSAGLIFRPINALHFIGNVSTAFRVPATFEKFFGGVAGAVTTLPNPGLKPESSMNYEIGARIRLQGLSVNLTAFRSDYKDLLQTVVLNATTRQRQNTGEATIEGFELDGAYAMTKELALRFNAANVRGTNTRTNTPLAYIPPLNGLVSLRYALPNNAYWIEATARWSVNKTRIDPSQERPTGGYGVLSIYAGVDLGRFDSLLKDYRLTLGIENLANKTYVNPVTQANVAFPASITNPLVEPGRSVTINLVSSIGR